MDPAFSSDPVNFRPDLPFPGLIREHCIIHRMSMKFCPISLVYSLNFYSPSNAEIQYSTHLRLNSYSSVGSSIQNINLVFTTLHWKNNFYLSYKVAGLWYFSSVRKGTENYGYDERSLCRLSQALGLLNPIQFGKIFNKAQFFYCIQLAVPKRSF